MRQKEAPSDVPFRIAIRGHIRSLARTEKIKDVHKSERSRASVLGSIILLSYFVKVFRGDFVFKCFDGLLYHHLTT